ncbi:protein spire homolog 2 isoform X4 [Pieris brassicae]|uniref:protein spire homolog 2 isoform X4 n=1 Tax=Pieris brassicae TaxID=7116 RepID=UPI001E661330|nr:protein spire homolog 2 isoform X4 [Pieris brassicae]
MSTVCALDAGGRVSLQQILQAFNSNVSEEHAWALCHQAARCFQRCLSSGTSPPPACFLPTRPSHLLLHADGSVHPDTLLDPTDDSSRPRIKSEYEVVVSLGLVVYRALDHTHGDDEERLISPDLEALISDMTLSNGNLTEEEEECGLSESLESVRAGDTDDEGIERDAEPPRARQRRLALFLLEDVVERCAWHAGVGRGRGARETAAAHYRAVCRALVAEALELASFLARVRVTAARDLGAADESASHLDTLQFSDWARFWMQVIGELRMGVKLKKVSHSRTPIEYELTPYEILMDDIRSRRYTLRKVDSSIPHNVKKDAHAMILEFIRSRPPLRKASERQLPPAKREATPREQLLRSIRLGRPLRPTPQASGSVSGGGSEDRRALSDVTRRTSGDVTPHTQPQRRLIKVDFDNLEDDEDDEETEKCASPPRPLPRHSAPPKPWKRTEAVAGRAAERGAAVADPGGDRAHPVGAHQGGAGGAARRGTRQRGRREEARVLPLPQDPLRHLRPLGAEVQALQEDRLPPLLHQDAHPDGAFRARARGAAESFLAALASRRGAPAAASLAAGSARRPGRQRGEQRGQRAEQPGRRAADGGIGRRRVGGRRVGAGVAGGLGARLVGRRRHDAQRRGSRQSSGRREAARRADGRVPRLQGAGAADHQVVSRLSLGGARPRPAAPHAGPGALLSRRRPLATGTARLRREKRDISPIELFDLPKRVPRRRPDAVPYCHHRMKRLILRLRFFIFDLTRGLLLFVPVNPSPSSRDRPRLRAREI